MNPPNVTESSITKAPATSKPAKERPKYRVVVRHTGLSRSDRRRFARAVRNNRPVRLLNGRNEMIDPAIAREFLKNTPKNVPIRKVLIDDRKTYVFEPQHQAGMQAFRKTVVDETAKLEGQEVTKELEQAIWIAGSRAYVEKVIELAYPKTKEGEKPEENV
jgi:hypothetical protein